MKRQEARSVIQGSVDAGVEAEIELLQGLLIAEVGPANGERKAFLASPGDLVLDDHRFI